MTNEIGLVTGLEMSIQLVAEYPYSLVKEIDEMVEIENKKIDSINREIARKNSRVHSSEFKLDYVPHMNRAKMTISLIQHGIVSMKLIELALDQKYKELKLWDKMFKEREEAAEIERKKQQALEQQKKDQENLQRKYEKHKTGNRGRPLQKVINEMQNPTPQQEEETTITNSVSGQEQNEEVKLE